MRTGLEAGLWCVGVLTVVLGAAAVRADWPAEGEAISAFPCEELPTATVADGRGGMFLVWTDARTCSHDDVYIQRITGSGAVATGWPGGGVPVCPLITGQSGAAAVSDQAGGAIVAWEDGRSALGTRLYVQRIAPDGTRRWDPEGVPVCDAPGSQVGFQILSDGSGGIFLAWMDTRRGLDDGLPHHHPLYDLYAQHIDAQGVRTWPSTGDSVATNAQVQAVSTLVTDGSSGVLITWLDGRGPVYLQHFDVSGAPHLPQGGVPIPGRFFGFTTSDGAGGIISAFSYGPDTQQDLYAQRVDSTGTLKWAVDGVLVESAPFDQRPSDILPDGSGGAFIASYDLRNGQDWDVYVQRITAAGTAAPGWPANGLVVCAAPGFQIYPRLVSDFAGGCLVAWYDARNPATAYDIYAQRVGAQGVVSDGWPANGAVLCQSEGDQVVPLPVSDGSGGALVAWSDYRVYADVYAQHVGRSGVVGDSSVFTGVEPSDRPRFALERVFPNPITGSEVFVSMSLPDASPAQLSLLDVNGRCLARQDLQVGPVDPMVIRLRTPGHLAPGLYLVQLTQAGRRVSRKVSVVK